MTGNPLSQYLQNIHKPFLESCLQLCKLVAIQLPSFALPNSILPLALPGHFLGFTVYTVRLVRLVLYSIPTFYDQDQPNFFGLMKPRESVRRITAAEVFALASGSPLPSQERTGGLG